MGVVVPTVADHGTIASPFLLQRQKQSNWCWAAIGVALDKYLKGSDRTQCDLVQTVKSPNGIDCCAQPDHPLCNSIDQITRVLGKLGVARRTNPPQPQGAVSFDVIKEDVARNRPLICLHSGATGLHYVLVVGWRLDQQIPWLLVDDPALGLRVTVSFADFFSYGGRTWIQTTRLA
jgi:hypothetical protein